MSIRIRTVNGITVALCAAETDEEPSDIYLDDAAHYALVAKFRRDWYGQTNDLRYSDTWAAMDTQKKRDATEELLKCLTSWRVYGRACFMTNLTMHREIEKGNVKRATWASDSREPYLEVSAPFDPPMDGQAVEISVLAGSQRKERLHLDM